MNSDLDNNPSKETDEASKWIRRHLSLHTEAKAIARYSLKPGQTMKLTGERPPCPSCKKIMKLATKTPDTNIVYQWRQRGELMIWKANQ